MRRWTSRPLSRGSWNGQTAAMSPAPLDISPDDFSALAARVGEEATRHQAGQLTRLGRVPGLYLGDATDGVGASLHGRRCARCDVDE